MRHEAVIAFQVGKDGAGLGTGKDDGQLRWPPDAFDPGDVVQFPIEHLLVEEEQCRECLILSRGGNVAVDGEVAQEGGDLLFAHLFGMALCIEQNEPADPIGVCLLGANAVVFDAQVPADAIKEFRGEARLRRFAPHLYPLLPRRGGRYNVVVR